MNIAGIDYSTQAIDIVLVDVDDGAARWCHYDLPQVGDAFERTREVAQVLPARRSVFWDTTLAIGIEEPMARGPRSVQLIPKLKAIQGAILSCIPRDKAVAPLDARDWRVKCGLKANASKDDVRHWAVAHIRAVPVQQPIRLWAQDAFDAYCIARAIEGMLE